jgi:hypothetical protein
MNREDAKGAKVFWYESGTPAEKALAGVTIRTKFSCAAGNLLPAKLSVLRTRQP